MPQAVPWTWRGGRLTDDELATFHAYADQGRSPYWIAWKLGRHPSTIGYQYVKAGYRPPGGTRRRGPAPGSRREPYQRGGRIVRPFLPEEDAFVLERRQRGQGWSQIARAVEKRFGWKRPPHSIGARLMQLATLED